MTMVSVALIPVVLMTVVMAVVPMTTAMHPVVARSVTAFHRRRSTGEAR